MSSTLAKDQPANVQQRQDESPGPQALGWYSSHSALPTFHHTITQSLQTEAFIAFPKSPLFCDFCD